MHYRDDEKQRGGDRHIAFSVQSVCLSALQPTTVDSSSRLIMGDSYAVVELEHPLSTYRLMTYLPLRFRALRAA